MLSPRIHGNVSVIGPSIPKVVLRSISVKYTMKICKRMFMDTIDSFSDEAGGGDSTTRSAIPSDVWKGEREA